MFSRISPEIEHIAHVIPDMDLKCFEAVTGCPERLVLRQNKFVDAGSASPAAGVNVGGHIIFGTGVDSWLTVQAAHLNTLAFVRSSVEKVKHSAVYAGKRELYLAVPDKGELGKLILDSRNDGVGWHMNVALCPPDGGWPMMLGQYGIDDFAEHLSFHLTEFQNSGAAKLVLMGDSHHTEHTIDRIELDFDGTGKVTHTEIFFDMESGADISSLIIRAYLAESSEEVFDFSENKTGWSVPEELDKTISAILDSVEQVEQPRVEILASLPAPDPERVQQHAFSLLRNMMVYAAEKDVREKLGESRPLLSERLRGLTEHPSVADFLKKRYAVGYVTHAYVNSFDPGVKKLFSAELGAKDKMKYFWEGHDTECFTGSPGFVIASTACLDEAYRAQLTGLDKYLDDAENWAKKLHDYVCSPEFIRPLARADENCAESVQRRIHHIERLLDTLDSEPRIASGAEGSSGKEVKISYGHHFYQEVMNARLQFAIAYLVPPDAQDLERYLLDTESILSKGQGLKEQTRHEIQLTREKALKHVRDEKHLREIAEQAAKQFAAYYFKESSMPKFKKFKKAMEKLGENSDLDREVVAYFQVCFGIGFTCIGFYHAIGTMMNWDKLEVSERIKGVLSILQFISGAIETITKINYTRMLSDPNVEPNALIEARRRVNEKLEKEQPAEILAYINAELDDDIAGLPREAQIAQRRVRDYGAKAGKWAACARLSKGFFTFFTLLLSGVGVILAILKAVESWTVGEYVSAVIIDTVRALLDSVSLICDLTKVVFSKLDGILASVPYIALAVAVAVAIIKLIDLFIERKEPKHPLKQFVDKYCIPFLESLTPVSSRCSNGNI